MQCEHILLTSCWNSIATSLLQVFTTCAFLRVYTRTNLTSCSKSANKPSTSCVRTACPKLSTSLEQAVNNFYYLFRKFLVSDWLTANCEIVISTQWLTKYGFFTFILAKWRQRVNTKKIWTRLRHITMTTRIILTRWRHWYDATTAAEGLRNCFFLNTNKIQMFVLNFLNK
jgi:hypothetical protein